MMSAPIIPAAAQMAGFSASIEQRLVRSWAREAATYSWRGRIYSA
jgi:hypothetical protein